MEAVLSVGSSLEHDGDQVVRYSISLANRSFAASTATWDNFGDHIQLADALEGFPTTSSSTVRYRFGTPGTGSCELDFFCIDALGHIGVWATFESTYPAGRSEQHETARLFMRCDPATIDEFVRSLRRFAPGSTNQADLAGTSD
jgi:hypothetical protein